MLYTIKSFQKKIFTFCRNNLNDTNSTPQLIIAVDNKTPEEAKKISQIIRAQQRRYNGQIQIILKFDDLISQV
ncbi:MAG: hypothetical protein LBQ24_04505 [Candidatus Peribacteria bacterium]|jgi:hypothetical protein|nr:hypothetical protein [Candidatus Peribacteria bacterium]